MNTIDKLRAENPIQRDERQPEAYGPLGRRGIAKWLADTTSFRHRAEAVRAGSIMIKLHEVGPGAIVLEHCGPYVEPEPPDLESGILLPISSRTHTREGDS